MSAIENYLLNLDPQHHLLTYEAHQLILTLVPQVQATIKWKIPYYTYIKGLCYLNPRNKVLDIGIVQGHLLSNKQGILIAENRKQVRIIRVSSIEELQNDAVKEIILEAALLREMNHK